VYSLGGFDPDANDIAAAADFKNMRINPPDLKRGGVACRPN
jgi:hypothetical protein